MNKIYFYSNLKPISIFCLTLLIIFLPSLVNAQTKSSIANRQLNAWKTNSFVSQGFKVSFPGDPEEFVLNDQLKNAIPILSEMDIRLYHFTATAAIYGISSAKKPPAIFDEVSGYLPTTAKGAATGYANGFLSGKDTIIISDKGRAQGSSYIRDVFFENGAMQGHLRVLAIKNKVYGLFVFNPTLRSAPEELVKVFNAEVNKFFDSFQLINAKQIVSKRKKR
jgi:hypothetical protein